MNTEKTRLDKMLQEHKISEEDYAILATALKRKTIFNKIHSTFLLNPFQKIAGLKALFLGMITLLLISFFGVKAQLFYLSPMSTINASVLAKQTITHPFMFLLGQNMICWLILATLLCITAKIIQKKKTRFVDFFGTIAFGRFPTLLVTLSILLMRIINPSLLDIDMSSGYPIHFSLMQYIWSIPIVVLAIWQAVIYFYAYKESSGLMGKKCVLSFLAAFIISEFSSAPLTTFFMN